MKKSRLASAIKEAKRFLEIAETVEIDPDSRNDYIYRSKESASVRRASMDLTNALVELRKGDYTK
jgi:hypothetical protein